MKFHGSLSLLILLSTLVSTSCSSESVRPSSSAGALTANSAIEGLTQRPFDRSYLAVSGLNTLNEFIRSDVRNRMDEEPVGDSDASYDPSSVETSSVTIERSEGEETQKPQEEVEHQQQPNPDEDAMNYGQTPDAKFQWAKKSFGDVVKGTPTVNGVIVLFADENIYDIHAMMRYIEEGRSRIAEKSEVPIDRIQVVFAGYRGVPQVELWVLPQGAEMPEFKTEDRSKAVEPEN